MKLTKQHLVTLIKEVLAEGLRKNPTVSPERLEQLRIKNAKMDPKEAGYMHYWMGASKVEDMEAHLEPEEYNIYKAAWARAENAHSTFFDEPLPPHMSQPYDGRSDTPSDLFKRRRGKSPLAKESMSREEYEKEIANMKDVTTPTLGAYLNPDFGMGYYATAVDADLKDPKTLRMAARASAIHGEPFPEQQLLSLFSYSKNADKMVAIAKAEYEKEMRNSTVL